MVQMPVIRLTAYGLGMEFIVGNSACWVEQKPLEILY